MIIKYIIILLFLFGVPAPVPKFALATWTSVPNPFTAYDFVAATWQNATECIFIGSNTDGNSAILRSTNSGVSWQTVAAISGYLLRDVSSYSNYTLAVAGVYSSLPAMYISTTRTSWSRFQISGMDDIYAITIASNGCAYVAGLQSSLSVIYSSTASIGFKTWKSINFPQVSTTIHGIKSVDGINIVAVGNGGFISSSTNSGQSWKSNVFSSSNLYSVSMASTQVGVAVGDSACIFRTTDYGQTWQNMTSYVKRFYSSITSFNFKFHSVAAPSANEIFLASTSGMILRSNNGGRNWSYDNSFTASIGTPLYSLAMYDHMTAIAGPASGYSSFFRRYAGSYGINICIFDFKYLS